MDTETRAKLRFGSRTCQCADCGLFFTGEKPFSQHLSGSGTDHVYCKSPAQMLKFGMHQNTYGVWMSRVLAPQKAKHRAA